MRAFPQLRVRTGYTFRDVYGRMSEVFDRIKALECVDVGIVDARGTWSHVRSEKEGKKREVNVMFGMEFDIIADEESEPDTFKFKQQAWALAERTREFYTNTTACVQNSGLFRDQFGAMTGMIKFCGGAIDRLRIDDFDYIDINPSSILLAAKGVALHRATGKPMVITSKNDMPSEESKDFAYAWEVRTSVGLNTIASLAELYDQLKWVMSVEEFKEAVLNTYAVADRLKGITLPKAPIIHLEGDMVALAREGMEYRLKAGHIKEWTKEYEDRFVEEIHQIQLKEFDSYFLVVADLVRYAKTQMLVGPARGSSAGSLVCYCMGITEVDPIPHKLLFQRFIDVSRADLPDIDIDFADTKRHLVFDYLREKYGAANVSKMGNINTLKAASVMMQVCKRFLIPTHEAFVVRNSLIEYSSGDARYGKGLQDTFDQTAPGQSFTKRFPEAAKCMGDLEIHPSHTGVHAAAILVCNDPISDYCTVNADGVAQIDKPDSEYLNLLKIDALGLRTLGVISDTGCVDADTLYGLTMDDPAVLEVINKDRVSGIFQFEGQAVRSVARFVEVDRFSRIDNLTALARPGPLASGMAQKYIERCAGREPVEYEAPQLEPYLNETMGVFLYQEQIMAVVKDIGRFDWVRTSAIRKAMSGRKGEEYFNQQGADFVSGAMESGLEEEKAKQIWNEMVTFGSWGFNKSHSVSYAIITYWTCWMKVYHRLEFAAACLRQAKSDEQTIAILRELEHEGVDYTPIDPDFSQRNWTVADGRLIGGIQNAKGFGPVLAAKYIEAREKGTLTKQMRARLANAEIKFHDLHEAHTKWQFAYDNPSRIGVSSGNPIEDMRNVKDKDNCLVIAKLTKKVLADENEAIRIKKRGGIRKEGLTQFLDLMCVDDSTDTPIRFRIKPKLFPSMGKPIAEGAPKGTWFLIKAWKLPDIDMMIVKNIKQLTNEDMPDDEEAVNPEEEFVRSEEDLAVDYIYTETTLEE